MLTLKRAAALRRELTAAQHIPCSAHVSEHVVRTVCGDYLQVFRLGGASFESADDEQLNTSHERLNVVLRNIASPNVALWTHIVRRRERCSVADEPVTGFAQALARKYRERLATETLMVNELYLAVLYRPAATVATGLAARLLSRAQPDSSQLELADALDACAKLAQTLRASLARYDPELLGAYRAGNSWCSSLLEFVGVLVNGEWQRMPLSRGPLNEALATTRLLFGAEAIEYRTPTGTRVG
ncbi:MAG: VirB4 family type IV secretion/conjugal transfer ATPase, partial [Steroidobacteraceae bacterium]